MKYIVYEGKVCQVVSLKENYIKGNDYYILKPLSDPSLKISVPVKSESIRDIISKEKAFEIINNIKNVETLADEKLIENEYKKLLDTNDLNDLVKIIKTTYLRNKERIENKKKISEKDEIYFNRAETNLYTELGVALNMKPEEVKEFIINYLQN